jgi:DNA-binding CsgD family transcriptional regulator/PAS domain-containing protein
MDEQVFANVVTAIYDTVVSPAQWTTALAMLAESLKCNVATLIDRNLKTMQGTAVSSGIDEAGQAEYFAIWSAKNVFIEATPRWTAGSIVTDQQLLPKSRLLASDYYNGFLAPRDMHSMLRISMRVEDNVHQSISLMRPGRQGEFDVPDVEYGRLFLPHLQRAATVSRNLNLSAAMLQTVNHLLEEKSDGVILVDLAGRVLFANRAARAMADKKDGFVLRHNRLEALRADHNRAFQKLLAGALGAIKDPFAGRAGVMCFARTAGAKDYIVMVTPVPQSHPVYSNLIPKACITISDPSAVPLRPLAMLQQLFGLTGAEARLAEHLFAGQTPDQAARSLDIKISTARTHIAQIFRKADVRRQSDLISLILRLR